MPRTEGPALEAELNAVAVAAEVDVNEAEEEYALAVASAKSASDKGASDADAVPRRRTHSSSAPDRGGAEEAAGDDELRSRLLGADTSAFAEACPASAGELADEAVLEKSGDCGDCDDDDDCDEGAACCCTMTPWSNCAPNTSTNSARQMMADSPCDDSKRDQRSRRRCPAGSALWHKRTGRDPAQAIRVEKTKYKHGHTRYAPNGFHERP